MIGHLNNKQGCFPEGCVLMSDENGVDTSSVFLESSRKLLPKETPDLFSNRNAFDMLGLALIIFLFSIITLFVINKNSFLPPPPRHGLNSFELSLK